jgi:RimJ/RimL family protein N-acetyltransferase
LRNLDHVKGRVGDSATDVASQEAWLRTYFDRLGDYYFVVETSEGVPLGTCAIYDVVGTCAETGRFIMRPDVAAAVPTSILSFDLAYNQMGLTELRATSVVSNLKVHSYLRRVGFRQVALEQGGRVIGGQGIDMIHFVQSAGDWLRVREETVALGRRAETQIREWEPAQVGPG